MIYKTQGRRFRLTDVSGEVKTDILSVDPVEYALEILKYLVNSTPWYSIYRLGLC